MTNFTPNPPEATIIELRISGANDDDGVYSREGILIVTNLRLLYYRKKIFKKELKLEMNLPLGDVKVKHKKRRYRDNYLVINKTDFVVSRYDNKMVALWLKDLVKSSKKFKGEPLGTPRPTPEFVLVYRKKHQDLTAQQPRAAPKILPLQPKSSAPLQPSATISSPEGEQCQYCGAPQTQSSNFCTECGKQR